MKRGNSGGIEIAFVIVVVLAAIFLVGGFGKMIKSKPSELTTITGSCCDSGDGESCKPQTEEGKTLTYKGQQYGLLKTQVELVEGNLHLKDSGETFDGQPIILNSSELHGIGKGYEQLIAGCNRPDPVGDPKDLYFKKRPADPYLFMRGGAEAQALLGQYCDSIPDDELIFVCKENCGSTACTFPVTAEMKISCYGSEHSVYDVYYRVADYEKYNVPGFIRNCEKTPGRSSGKTKIIGVSDQPERENLQLQTFGIVNETINPGLSPFCKPAIYLYPEKKTQVSVQVFPSGNFTYTDPLYPTGGWSVIASSDGTITYNNKTFPYLYYEADIVSSLIKKPSTGYMVKRSNIESFLKDLLPTLGLNAKETNEMAAYWQKALPESTYYFVGQLPIDTIESLSKISIDPQPDTILRISLYFEASETNTPVKTPKTSSAISRKGFTTVEWGGVVKTDKPFTCFQ